MRVGKGVAVLFVSMGVLSYTGCSILSPQNDSVAKHISKQDQYSFAYNVVVNHKPAQDELVFDDGKKTYFKIPVGDNVSQAYLIDHTGYNQVDIQNGASYWYSDNIGKKWVIFLASGGQIVSSKIQLPNQLPEIVNKEVEKKPETSSAPQLTVQDRIKQLEKKLSGMVGVLREYSTKNKKAKEILVQLDQKPAAVEKVVENSAINKSNNTPIASSAKEDLSTEGSSVLVNNISNKNTEQQTDTKKESIKKDYIKVIKTVAAESFSPKEKLVELKAVNVAQKPAVESVAQKNIADVVSNAKKSIVEIRETISKTLKDKIAANVKYNKSIGRDKYEANVPFAYGYRRLGPKGTDSLSGVAVIIKNSASAKSVEIMGMATEDGAPERNEWLASERASAVKKALIDSGVNPEIIQTKRREQDQYGLAVKVSVTYNAELLTQN